MCERCRVFSYFSTSPFRVRATVYANYLLQTHPPLFFATRRPRNIFQLPDEVCDKKKSGRERGEVKQASKQARGAAASRSCHTVDKRIVRISGVIYSRLRAIVFRSRNFLFSLTDETGSAKKTTIRRATDAVRPLGAWVWN